MPTCHLDSASNTKFLEILSGHGGLSKALQSLGHIVHSCYKKNDPKHDILDKKCARRIKRLIEKINCIGVWFGMPCGTFTSARRYDGKGPKPIRSREHVLGLPTLCGRDKLRVDLANKLVDLMYDLCLLCWKTGTSFYIDNPRSSLLWVMPTMKLLAFLTGVQQVRFDYCQFGATLKKKFKTIMFLATFSSSIMNQFAQFVDVKYVLLSALLTPLYRATLKTAIPNNHFVLLLLNLILQHYVPNGHN